MLTCEVAKRLGLASANDIHHLILLSSTGDELSTMLRSSHSFWEVVESMSVNTEDGMYFEVHVDKGAGTLLKRIYQRMYNRVITIITTQ